MAWESDAGGEFSSVHPGNLNLVERNLIASASDGDPRAGQRLETMLAASSAVDKGFRKQSRRRLENFDVVK